MAKLKVFCVYDSKVEAYMRPFYARSIGEALRIWESSCRDSQSGFSQYPADYTLFLTGEFDESSGRFIQHQALVSYGTALECLSALKQSVPGLKAVSPGDKSPGNVQAFSEIPV